MPATSLIRSRRIGAASFVQPSLSLQYRTSPPALHACRSHSSCRTAPPWLVNVLSYPHAPLIPPRLRQLQGPTASGPRGWSVGTAYYVRDVDGSEMLPGGNGQLTCAPLPSPTSYPTLERIPRCALLSPWLLGSIRRSYLSQGSPYTHLACN